MSEHAAEAHGDGGASSPAASPRKGAHARKSSRYIASIDGLRAFAVLSVIFYHMRLGWAPGGLMGVTVFFVISGYLINGLLVQEHDWSGRIDLPQFWLRRVRRLFPAIALAVVGTWAACAWASPLLLSRMVPDIAPSLLFFNNWWQIFHDVSYFENAFASSPLKHFWSLAIEEQFYLVWPPLLYLLLRKGVGKRALAVLVAVLAVASAVEMGLLYDPTGDPSRAYYGTDTRAMSLLAGVWLAFAWPASDFASRTSAPGKAAGVALNLVGVAALAGLIALVAFSNGYSDFPYRGGIALTSVLAALLIAVLVVPGTWVDRLFSLKPLVWVGKISYGMYLWHYPVILLTTDANSTTATPWYVYAGQLALTIAIAALSYYAIENPIRHGALGSWVRAVRAREQGVGVRTAKGAVPAACFAGLLAFAIWGTVESPAYEVPDVQAGQLAASSAAEGTSGAQSDAAPDDATGQVGATVAAGLDGLRSLGAAESAGIDGDADASSSESAQAASSSAASPDAGADESAEARAAYFAQPHYAEDGVQQFEPLLIGDSVSLGAEAEFYRVFPNGVLDAAVSRNIWESPYWYYEEDGSVGTYLVFCLGTNNAVEDWQIDDDLLAGIPDDKKIYMVNTRSNTEWFQATNEAIARTPERHPNVTVIDWYAASEGHDEYFAGDGTHLTEEGAAAYIELIRSAIVG